MNGQIDLSIIIPCHNLENYILPLLSSFKLLKFDNYEVEFIFVLDACTDNTRKIIEEEMPPTLKWYIIECNHHKCGLARNEGLEIARGRYIWFVDGDDWIIYYNVIPDCLNIMNKGNHQILLLKFVSNFFKIQHFSMVWQYIYRRDYIGNMRFLPIELDEDVEWSKILLQPFIKTGLPTYDIPVYFYNYLRPGSNTTQFMQDCKN